MQKSSKRGIFSISIFLILMLFSACSTVRSPTLNTVDIKTTDFSQEFKTAQSCQNYIFGFIGPFGDASVIKAAKKQQISKIELVDYKDSFYFLFSQSCVVVYGK